MSFIPLSSIERCDLCNDLHALRKVHFDGRQFICRKCREEEPKRDRIKTPVTNTAWKP